MRSIGWVRSIWPRAICRVRARLCPRQSGLSAAQQGAGLALQAGRCRDPHGQSRQGPGDLAPSHRAVPEYVRGAVGTAPAQSLNSPALTNETRPQCGFFVRIPALFPQRRRMACLAVTPVADMTLRITEIFYSLQGRRAPVDCPRCSFASPAVPCAVSTAIPPMRSAAESS